MAAATYDISQGSNTQLPANGVGQIVVVERVADFADQNVANVESVTVINIPANTMVLGVSTYVDTAEGTDAIDVGDSASHDCYLAVGSLATADVTLWSDTSTGTGRALVLAATKYYTAANDIRITAHTGNLASGKVTVRALMVKFAA